MGANFKMSGAPCTGALCTGTTGLIAQNVMK